MSFYGKFSAGMSVLLLMSSPLAIAKKMPKLSFEKQQINIESPITGELLYLSHGKTGTDVLIQQSNSFTLLEDFGAAELAGSAKEIPIPESVIFYNKGKLAAKDHEVLFYLTAESVIAYDLKSGTNETLISDNHLYREQSSVVPKQADFVLDINSDGLTDVITSSFTHINVYLQTLKGDFIKTRLELAPHSHITEHGVQFSEYKAHILDVNNDNKTDLVFQIDNELLAFVQNKDQGLNTQALKISLNSGLLTPKQNAKQALENKAENKKVKPQISFERLQDLDGDGLTDLITKARSREGMTSSSSEYQIRYGALINGLLSYSDDVDTVMQLNGEGDVKFTDINNDGISKIYMPLALNLA